MAKEGEKEGGRGKGKGRRRQEIQSCFLIPFRQIYHVFLPSISVCDLWASFQGGNSPIVFHSDVLCGESQQASEAERVVCQTFCINTSIYIHTYLHSQRLAGFASEYPLV